MRPSAPCKALQLYEVALTMQETVAFWTQCALWIWSCPSGSDRRAKFSHFPAWDFLTFLHDSWICEIEKCDKAQLVPKKCWSFEFGHNGPDLLRFFFNKNHNNLHLLIAFAWKHQDPWYITRGSTAFSLCRHLKLHYLVSMMQLNTVCEENFPKS